MLYLDTSLVVSLIAVEPSTRAAQQWLGEQGEEELVISDWVVTEASSALSVIQRVTGLDEHARRRAERNLQALTTAVLGILAVTRQAFRTAATTAGRADLSLRAGDALHLAVAAEHGARVATRDVAQARAAESLGVGAVLVVGQDDGRP
jgi:predicted nucleic acid-binding protein